MTFTEAVTQAKYLWGVTGMIQRQGKNHHVGHRLFTIMGVEAMVRVGEGTSWEQAFENAQQRCSEQAIALGPNTKSYAQHPAFTEPANPKSTIRRYMPLARFQYLAETAQLWFSRVDQMKDIYEGAYPASNDTLRTVQYYQELERSPVALGKKPTLEKYLNAIHERNHGTRKCIYVNCWQLNEAEDIGMWERYIPDGQGIAIESTFSRLNQSFLSVFEQPIHVGNVAYSDYESPIDEDYQYRAFLTKRKSYDHERELRALLWLPPFTDNGINYEKHDQITGIEVKVNLKTLVHRIVISPDAPKGFISNIRALTQTFGLPDPIPSALTRIPTY
jgi:hypothetical protein